MDHDVRSLQAFMEARFDGIERRFDDLVDRADRIEVQTTMTNGRVTRVEEQIRTLFMKLKDRASRVVHEAEKLPLTLVSLRWWIVAILATITGTYYVVTDVLGFHR